MTSPETFFYESVEAQGEALSELIAVALMKDVEEKGEALLVLPGGSSPRALITWLAQIELPWKKVQISVTDERCVPVKSEHSNIGQIIKLFSEQGREINAAPLWDDERGVRADARALNWPASAIVLGMGTDGHTASLFPGGEWGQGDDMVLETLAPFDPSRRVSFSMDVLTSAENLILLVNGDEKWDLFKRIEAGEYAGTPLEELINRMGGDLKAHVVAQGK